MEGTVENRNVPLIRGYFFISFILFILFIYLIFLIFQPGYGHDNLKPQKKQKLSKWPPQNTFFEIVNIFFNKKYHLEEEGASYPLVYFTCCFIIPSRSPGIGLLNCRKN